jgi:hypothetical protein
MRLLAYGITTVLLVAVSAPVGAQTVLKQEPRAGALRPGEKILVESARCSRGQVMEVTGGTLGSRNNAAAAGGGAVQGGGQARQYRCVPRPG